MRWLPCLFSCTTISAAAIGSPTFAQKQLQDIGYAPGICEKLKVGKTDMTKQCDRKLANTTYADGTVGFYFIMKNGGIVTFSGSDRPNPTPDTDLISIERIIFGAGGTNKQFAATGSCRYGNFYAGHKRVTCKGQSDDGQTFEAVFRLTAPPEPM